LKSLGVVVAVARNGVIGRDNGLPWRLRADLQWFKQITTGHSIVMGRKTYESIGRPLPNRENIVISRQTNLSLEGCIVVDSLNAARERASHDTVMVIGGAQIYRQALPLADQLFLTLVDADVEGDTWLPFIDLDAWSLHQVEIHAADENNQYPVEFRTYRRE